MAELRKYATATDIYFPLIARGLVDFTTAATYASGDIKISIDGASAASSTNGFSLVTSSNGVYKLVLTSGECTGKEILVTVVDQSSPKIWEDQSINVCTYGNASAELVADFSTGYATPTNITAGTITTVTNLTNAATAGDLTATMKSSVNAEVVDVINTDTGTELSTVPAAAAPLRQQIQFAYQAIRNKNTTTATQNKLYKDDGSVFATAALTDNGTIFTKDEFA